MSCVVGLIYQGKAYLAGDSACTNEAFQLAISPEPKVFQLGEFAIGCTGSPRILQILHYQFTPPVPTGDLMRYMVTAFVPALKECLKADEQKSDDLLAGSSIMVGVRDRLFVVYSDFQIEEFVLEYNAIGNANDVAYGALHATRCLENNPLTRLRIALEAAQEHDASVREPFVYVCEEINNG